MLSSSKTILYADDDPDDFELLCEALKGLDPELKVIHANNGVEAIELLELAKQGNRIPALIILDINMPKMDGKQTLAEIKKDPKLRSVPTVLFSTSSSPSDFTYASQFGVELIDKPVRFKNLAVILQKLLLLGPP